MATVGVDGNVVTDVNLKDVDKVLAKLEAGVPAEKIQKRVTKRKASDVVVEPKASKPKTVRARKEKTEKQASAPVLRNVVSAVFLVRASDGTLKLRFTDKTESEKRFARHVAWLEKRGDTILHVNQTGSLSRVDALEAFRKSVKDADLGPKGEIYDLIGANLTRLRGE